MENWQQLLQRCKLLYPAMDQFLGAESKLQVAVTHVVSALNSTIASLEDILQVLSRSQVLKELYEIFSHISSHYSQLVSTLVCLESSIVIQLLTKLNKETEHFKRNITVQEKCKAKTVRAIKSRIKKKEKEITKLQKKVRKEEGVSSEKGLEAATRELYSSYKDMEDLEETSREALRETEEQYMALTLSCLQAVFKEENKLYRSNEALTAILGLIQQVNSGNSQDSQDDTGDKDGTEDRGDPVEPEEEVIDVKPPAEPEVLEEAKSVQDTSLGSRAGSILSLSSLASFSCREESSQVFSTIKRCHSPFTLSPTDLPRRQRDSRRRLELSRPPLPPLPPRPHTHGTQGSLSHLRHKLEVISGLSEDTGEVRKQRWPHMEDDITGELDGLTLTPLPMPSINQTLHEGSKYNQINSEVIRVKYSVDSEKLTLDDSTIPLKISTVDQVNERSDPNKLYHQMESHNYHQIWRPHYQPSLNRSLSLRLPSHSSSLSFNTNFQHHIDFLNNLEISRNSLLHNGMGQGQHQ